MDANHHSPNQGHPSKMAPTAQDVDLMLQRVNNNQKFMQNALEVSHQSLAVLAQQMKTNQEMLQHAISLHAKSTESSSVANLLVSGQSILSNEPSNVSENVLMTSASDASDQAVLAHPPGTMPQGASPMSPCSAILASVPNANASIVSGQFAAPGCLFELPEELRRTIYAFLIPEPKVITARAYYRAPRRRAGPKRWEFEAVEDLQPHRPVLSSICTETRSFLLERGTYIFKQEESDGGLWWNSRHDVLVFCDIFCARFSANALEGLQGLEHVHHVGLDPQQAMSLGYSIHYAHRYDLSRVRQQERKISRVDLVWFARSDNERYYPFIPEFFPNIHSVTVCFGHGDITHGCYLRNNECCVRLDLDETDLGNVRHQLGRYGDLWQEKNNNTESDLWDRLYDDWCVERRWSVPALYYEDAEAQETEETGIVTSFFDMAFRPLYSAHQVLLKEHFNDPWDVSATY